MKKRLNDFLDEAGRCWAGHKPVPGKKPYSPGSCVKEEVELDEGLKNKVGAALTAAAVSASPHAHSISVPSFNMAPATYVTQIKPKQDQEASRKAGRAFPLSQKSKELMKKEEVEQIDEGYIPIVVPKMIKEPTTKKPMPDIGMHPAKQKAIADKKAGKAYKNPYPFDKNKSAPENSDHNMYKATFHHYKEEYEADDGPLTEDQLKQLEEVAAWQRKEGKNPEGGLNRKGIESYRRENPGSKLSMAVTTKPSKLKPGSKAANRRKSFCSRMSGMKRRLTSAKTARDPDSRINKALRKWNC